MKDTDIVTIYLGKIVRQISIDVFRRRNTLSVMPRNMPFLWRSWSFSDGMTPNWRWSQVAG